MFYSNKSFALITSSLIALGFATQAMAGTIGIVDKDKVVTSYPKAQQAAEQTVRRC
jgi:Skp family chaperone for outer membrane proteins